MSLKEMDQCFRAMERGIRAMEKALRREAVLNERKRRNNTLIQVAEEMRKKGASKRSIQLAVEGANEYLKPARKTSQSEKPESTPTPAPNVGASGILLSEVETRQVAWLWERCIPLGKITILDGDPGMGKSLIAA